MLKSFLLRVGQCTVLHAKDSMAGWCTEHHTADGPQFRLHTTSSNYDVLSPNTVVERHQYLAGEACIFLSNLTFPTNVKIRFTQSKHTYLIESSYHMDQLYQLPTITNCLDVISIALW